MVDSLLGLCGFGADSSGPVYTAFDSSGSGGDCRISVQSCILRFSVSGINVPAKLALLILMSSVSEIITTRWN